MSPLRWRSLIASVLIENNTANPFTLPQLLKDEEVSRILVKLSHTEQALPMLWTVEVWATSAKPRGNDNVEISDDARRGQAVVPPVTLVGNTRLFDAAGPEYTGDVEFNFPVRFCGSDSMRFLTVVITAENQDGLGRGFVAAEIHSPPPFVP